MTRLRAFGLTLFLGWHFVAGGVGSLLHTCRMAAAMSSTASCKCAHDKHARDGADQLLRSDCCSQELVRADLKPALRESVRSVEGTPFLAVLPSPTPGEATDVPSLQLRAIRISAPSQGPPIFLKTRSILI